MMRLTSRPATRIFGRMGREVLGWMALIAAVLGLTGRCGFQAWTDHDVAWAVYFAVQAAGLLYLYVIMARELYRCL